MFIGSYIFEFLGVLAKWVIQFPICFILKRKRKSFIEIWDGPPSVDGADNLMYGFSNVFVGVIVLIALLKFILWIGW